MKAILHEQIIKGVVHDVHLSEPEIFVDNEKKGRSGHVGHALVEFKKGHIMDFYANTSAKRVWGHSAFGWMEYRISKNYGKSFSKPKIFQYSYDILLDGMNAVTIEKAVSRKDGCVTAFCTLLNQCTDMCFDPHEIPKVVRSLDGGKTWEEPYDLCKFKGRVFDAIEYNNSFYVLQFCNANFLGTSSEHLYRIFKSDDNGASFYEYSVVPFETTIDRSYGSMIINEKGELNVYIYNAKDQQNLDYIVSSDMGKTWTKTRKSFVKNMIRNPQVGYMNGQYFLHGRAGEDEHAHGGFVLYTSKDGITWDDGKILIANKSACFYSNNLTIKMPNGKSKMLVQYSENIREPNAPWTGVVNIMHFWLEDI